MGKNNKRRVKPPYESAFFKASETKSSNGKVVYIRQEFHNRLLKIVQVIGNNETSLFDYLDNVLAQHFADYKEEMNELYERKIKPNVF